MFVEYTTDIKREREREDKKGWKNGNTVTPLRMSKQKCMNDLLGERMQDIILSINLNIMTS